MEHFHLKYTFLRKVYSYISIRLYAKITHTIYTPFVYPELFIIYISLTSVNKLVTKWRT